MINVNNIRKTVVTGLKKYLGCPVIASNQNEKPPAYPFGSYTITTPKSENKGTYGEYEDGIKRIPVTQTWSITFQSDNEMQAEELALKAHDWLDLIGKLFLNDNGVIVQSVTNVMNRSNILTVEYEYKYGFDVVFWTLNEIAPDEGTETIEEVSINDTTIKKGGA